MTDQLAAAVPISAERLANREKIAALTQKGNELYTALQNNSHRRDELIVDEMAAGAIARELAELTGLSVGRIYKLRDNGLARK